jgi:hypothetical protein
MYWPVLAKKAGSVEELIITNPGMVVVVSLFRGGPIPDSLTREEGFVDQNCKHPRQTIPHGFTRTIYYDEKPLFFGASAPQF